MNRRKFIGIAAIAAAVAGGAISTTYAASNQQRGPGNGIGGQVTSVSGTTITVSNPRGTETIATTSSTTFTVDSKSASLSEIKSGLYLHAEGTKASDGSFTATKVDASTTKPTPPQDGGRGPGGPGGPGGQVTGVSGTTITITTPRGTETIATTSSTTFTLDGKSASLSEIKSGLYLHAEGTKASDGSFTATKVMASTTKPTPPQDGGRGPGGPGGQVTGVSGTTITVTTPRGSETIATTSSTTFTVDGKSASLSEIKSGLYLHAEGTEASNGSFTATKVDASTTKPTPPQDGGRGPGGPGGQVSGVSGTTITVTNPRGSETIATTSSTTFTLDGKSASLSEIKSGLYLHAEGTKASDGSFTATKIVASTTKPTPPQGGGRGRP